MKTKLPQLQTYYQWAYSSGWRRASSAGARWFGQGKQVTAFERANHPNPPIYDLAMRVLRSCIFGSASLILSKVVAQNMNTCFEAPLNLTVSVIALGTLAFTCRLCLRYLLAIGREYKLRALAQNQDQSNVTLLVRPQSDWNGAATTLTSRQLSILKKARENSSLVIQQAGTVQDINDAIDKITSRGQKITTLWIDAHGRPTRINLGKEDIEWESLKLSKLSRKAVIILNACTAGAPVTGELNTAELCQYHAGPNRKVIAPTTLTTGSSFVYENETFRFLVPYFPWNHDATADISYQSAVAKYQRLEQENAVTQT